MILKPISLREARAFVKEHHRHHDPPQGGKFALRAIQESTEAGLRVYTTVGVAIVGRPVSRVLDDGWTAEVIRVATDGTENACSYLYGAAKRAAQAMGYRRVITYTLAEESGASLRAVGWKNCGLAGGGSWRCQSRPRAADSHPLQEKIRWEAQVREKQGAA